MSIEIDYQTGFLWQDTQHNDKKLGAFILEKERNWIAPNP